MFYKLIFQHKTEFATAPTEVDLRVEYHREFGEILPKTSIKEVEEDEAIVEYLYTGEITKRNR